MQGLPYRLQTWLLAQCFTYLLRRESLRTREPGFIVLDLDIGRSILQRLTSSRMSESQPLDLVIWFRPKPQNPET